MIDGARQPRFIFSSVQDPRRMMPTFFAPKFFVILNPGRHAQEADGSLSGIAVATVCLG